MAERHTAQQWFTVDPVGLKQLLTRRGPAFIVHELVQNAWDAPGVKRVVISLKRGRYAQEDCVVLGVADDAIGGVEDLRNLYTLFAPSKKKGDVKLRGRFNVGEKLAIACSKQARVSTVAGTILYRASGRREYVSSRTTLAGTDVELALPERPQLLATLLQAARNLIPPDGIQISIFQGETEEVLLHWIPVAMYAGIPLPTEVAKEDGLLRPTTRQTTIELYETQGAHAWLYELGIPVCEIALPWHVNVGQKVPLTLDRVAVTRPFLRELGLHVLNHAYQLLTPEQAVAPWVREAAAHGNCKPEATKHLMTLRFGERVVAYDPSDTEANMRAASEGYVVVHGGSLSAGEWTNAKTAAAILPAGKVTGTSFALTGPGDESGKTLDELTLDQMSSREKSVADYMIWLAEQLVGPVRIRFFRDRTWDVIAACGADREMVVNLGKFQWWRKDEIHAVVLHELAHIRETNHLDDAYHREVSRLGARLAAVATTGTNFRLVAAFVEPRHDVALAATRE